MRRVSGSPGAGTACFSFSAREPIGSPCPPCGVPERKSSQTRAAVTGRGRPSAGGRLAAGSFVRAPRGLLVGAASPLASHSPLPITGVRPGAPSLRLSTIVERHAVSGECGADPSCKHRLLAKVQSSTLQRCSVSRPPVRLSRVASNCSACPRNLTSRSRRRPPASFACLRSRLTSNVRQHKHAACALGGITIPGALLPINRGVA